MQMEKCVLDPNNSIIKNTHIKTTPKQKIECVAFLSQAILIASENIFS